jgi:uncharacterized protein YceH (UPF0502 family)
MFSKSQNSAMFVTSWLAIAQMLPKRLLAARIQARTIAANGRAAGQERFSGSPGAPALHSEFRRYRFAMKLPALSLLETRVLGVLVEKQHTVPDTYPLTLNALVAGCSQKTSRDPVIEASEADVQAAVDHLRQLSLVIESSGGRVMRYAQNVGRVLSLPPESVALLATLMLRGPQTPAEVRQNCERMHRFADVSSVEAYLDQLADRSAGALVAELPRAAGSRENRWMHLLSGPPSAPAQGEAVRQDDAVVGAGELAALKRNVDELAREVHDIKSALARVMQELGITR